MDVIFALASGAGKAAVAVIRLSGAGTREVLARLAGPVPAPRRVVLRKLQGPQGLLDEALVLWMPGPGSFTGEDVAELHIHGSRAVQRAVLDTLAAMPGCRMAEPGEFARRAFRNGKRDLAALEGLADLIDAETEAQRRQALNQLSGEPGRRIARWRDELLTLQAAIEAELDFADEGDVVTDLGGVHAGARMLAEEIAAVLAQAPAAERLRAGFRVVIAGPPNAGKSSLLNALARREAAIVTDIPGTTRDVLDVHLDLRGLAVILSDTAGLRDSVDAIEQEGIRRAVARIEDADLVLWLSMDAAAPPAAPPSVLRVATQRDRFASDPSPIWADHAISVVTGLGVEPLVDAIADTAERATAGGDAALIVRSRHAAALAGAVGALRRAGRAGSSPELMAEDLRLAQTELGRIVGRTDVEDVLDAIFSRFCIGK